MKLGTILLMLPVIISTAVSFGADWLDEGKVLFIAPPQEPVQIPTLLSVAISGDSVVAEKDTSQYALTGYYDDATTSDLTASASWNEITSLSNVTLGATGLITVGDRDTTNNYTYLASCGGFADTNTVSILGANEPPAFAAGTIYKAAADENVAYTGQSIASSASDPEGDALTFSTLTTGTWLTVASDGTLSGTPGAGDSGTGIWTVMVQALGGSDLGTLQITVTSNSAPTFASGTYLANAMQDVAYSQNFESLTGDADGDTLTAGHGASNPAWATLDTNLFTLAGTPADSDVGTNDFMLYISDGYLNTTSTVSIIVAAEPVAPTGTLYPMPDTNGVPAIALPAGFAAFTPPVSNYTGNAVISEWGRQAQPGDTIPLTAEDLP